MPLYVRKCQCGHTSDYYQTIEGRDSVPNHCGQPVRRIITAPSMVIGACKPFVSMLDGREVTSLAKYRADLRAHGMVELGNEQVKPKPRKLPAGIKDDLIRLANEKLR